MVSLEMSRLITKYFSLGILYSDDVHRFINLYDFAGCSVINLIKCYFSSHCKTLQKVNKSKYNFF